MNDKTKIPRRNTHQKQMILETLVKLGSHVSASEIYKEIAKTSTDASRASQMCRGIIADLPMPPTKMANTT